MDVKKILSHVLWHAEKWVLGFLLLIFVRVMIGHMANLFVDNVNIDQFTVKVIQKEDLLASLSVMKEKEFNNMMDAIAKPASYKHVSERNLFSIATEKVVDQSEPVQTNTDKDEDGIPDEWELKYGLDPDNPKDAGMDNDKDSFSNLDEYIHATDPNDKESFPGKLKLNVKNIFKKKVQIRFFGYVELPGGANELQINWGKNTEFPKVGQKIHGYEILDFTKDIQKRFNPLIGDYEIVDESFIRIQKQGADPIKLIVNKPAFEKELFAVIQDFTTGEEFVVHGGAKIKSYEVLDIMPTRVIIVRNKKIYTLTLERR